VRLQHSPGPCPSARENPTFMTVPVNDTPAKGLAAGRGATDASVRPAKGLAAATSPPTGAAPAAADASGGASGWGLGAAPTGPRRARIILRFDRVASSALLDVPQSPGSCPWAEKGTRKQCGDAH
jgi:hypothetical protein